MNEYQIVQIIIQGGAVGVLVFFGWGVYKLTGKGMDYVNVLVSNHLTHVVEEIGALRSSIDRLTTLAFDISKQADNIEKKQNEPKE